jgi:hypothetical protein
MSPAVLAGHRPDGYRANWAAIVPHLALPHLVHTPPRRPDWHQSPQMSDSGVRTPSRHGDRICRSELFRRPQHYGAVKISTCVAEPGNVWTVNEIRIGSPTSSCKSQV